MLYQNITNWLRLIYSHTQKQEVPRKGTDMLIDAKQHRTPGQKADYVIGHVSTLYSR